VEAVDGMRERKDIPKNEELAGKGRSAAQVGRAEKQLELTKREAVEVSPTRGSGEVQPRIQQGSKNDKNHGRRKQRGLKRSWPEGKAAERFHNIMVKGFIEKKEVS